MFSPLIIQQMETDLIFRIVNVFEKPKNMEEWLGYAYIFTTFCIQDEF